MINKNSSVTCIKWYPGSENLFMVGFDDGSVVSFDKDKDEVVFSTNFPSIESKKA